MLPIRRAFADLPHGQVHYASCGKADARAVLLLHQTPRSWTEYRAVLPLMGRHFRAIAMDTAGFGDSAPLPEAASIEGWARVAVQLLDALHIRQAHVVGHHTGGVIAVELAATHGERVRSLVLSSTPYTNEAFRIARAQRPPIDAVEHAPDGDHLTALWRKRQGFYPAGRPDLLQAFVADALKTSGDVEGGHRAVAGYRMEDRVERLAGRPMLLVHAPDDPFASPHTAEWREQLPHAHMAEISGGMVPLPDQYPEAFAAAVTTFLEHAP
jgi:pimeloyl-ACP methyl ester carboxylesterase